MTAAPPPSSANHDLLYHPAALGSFQREHPAAIVESGILVADFRHVDGDAGAGGRRHGILNVEIARMKLEPLILELTERARQLFLIR